MSRESERTTDIVMVRHSWRLAGPAPTPSFVDRTRLDDRFVDAVGRVMRVIAPGGYGKSTIVGRWLASDERAARWLDVEPFDNDPLVLAATLELTLAELAEVRPSATGREWTTITAAKVIRQLLEHTRPFVLVIDDIHHIEHEDSTALIELIAERLPAESTLVLVGRAHHGGSTARLRTGDDLIAIDDHLDELAAEIGAASVSSTDRWASLTDAELRVLQYQPTNLSLSDVGVKLFVSRSTVKSHTASIYRKLGASSRTEAVEIARRSGLIANQEDAVR